jgi:hypothetical protein
MKQGFVPWHLDAYFLFPRFFRGSFLLRVFGGFLHIILAPIAISLR